MRLGTLSGKPLCQVCYTLLLEYMFGFRACNSRYVFGYGSLIWNPGFPYLSSRKATVKGFIRRFWNKSADHRGTEVSNGLVVCLSDLSDMAVMHEKTEVVEGVLFEISHDILPIVLEELDRREKYGYVRTTTTAFCPASDAIIGTCFVYTACYDSSIDVFLKPQRGIVNTEDELQYICEVISKSDGPSGKNIDYLLKLKESLDDLGFHDSHVNEVYRACLDLR